VEDNLTLIKGEFEKLKGQFVITDSWRIERLVAIGEDEWDYYYITYDGRKLTWNTCVGRIMPLKGYLRDKDYNEFIRLAKLNHYDQATLWGNSEPEKYQMMVDSHLAELLALPEDHKFLTPVCLDLN
jgi:hypothetical protein